MTQIPCGHDEDLLILYAMNELGPAQRLDVEQRIASCAHCQGVVQAVSGVRSAIPRAPEIDFARAAEARGRAIDQIERGSVRARLFRWRHAISEWTTPTKWATNLALGALLIAAGYGIASIRGASTEAGSADPAALSVQQVGRDPLTGDVVAQIDEGGSRMVRGSLGQVEVQTALASAVRQEGNLRIRLHALRAVQQGAPQPLDERDPLIRAMLEVLRREEPDAVRLRAVQALDRLFEGTEFPAAVYTGLLDVITGAGGPAVRIAALDALVSRQIGTDAAVSLAKLAASDPNSYVRLTAGQALQSAGPLEEVPRP